MSSVNKAFPEITVICRDGERNFCLDYGAFECMEKHLLSLPENKNKKSINVFRDFDWDLDTNMTNLKVVIWAGFQTDARLTKRPISLDDISSTIDLVGMAQCLNLAQEAMLRCMPEAEKKMLMIQTATKEAKERNKKLLKNAQGTKKKKKQG